MNTVSKIFTCFLFFNFISVEAIFCQTWLDALEAGDTARMNLLWQRNSSRDVQGDLLWLLNPSEDDGHVSYKKSSGNKGVIEFLVTHGADPNLSAQTYRQASGLNSKLLKAFGGSGEEIAYLPSPFELALERALRTGDTSVLQVLVKHEAKVDFQSPHASDPPLNFAVSWIPFLEKIQDKNRLKVSVFLVTHGADVNRQSTGRTVLQSAAATTDDPNLVELLLKHGASVNSFDSEGQTALTLALHPFGDKPHTRVAGILKKYGATE